ncbi:MAG: hypothetical protein FD180_4341 [Planctomycetota bacterium]|nr:MAG: hypothetical protein FD180_4341 [Planctomycetota bacterium]
MKKRDPFDWTSSLGTSPNLNPQTPPEQIPDLPDFVRAVESHLREWGFWVGQREELQKDAPRALHPQAIAAKFEALGNEAKALHSRAQTYYNDLSFVRTHEWADGGFTGHYGVHYAPMPEKAKEQARCCSEMARHFLILSSVQGIAAPQAHLDAIRKALVQLKEPLPRQGARESKAAPETGDDALVDHVQIAEAWGEKPENVRKRLSNARRKRRISIDDYNPVDNPKKGKPHWRYRYGAIKFLRGK